jgi:hypothetical protein
VVIHVAMSGDRNMVNKEAENVLKYKHIAIEIERMWTVKTNVIPITRGATGTIWKSFRKYLSNLPGKHEISKL